MNYKLKHLAKYCCKTANELEFEAVKMAAEIGGVVSQTCKFDEEDTYLSLNQSDVLCDYFDAHPSKVLIPVLDFIKKLRMTEEEIKRAQWKEGEVYEVWDDGCQHDERYLAISSKDYGWFWISSKKKTTTQWTNFKRITQC